MVSAITANLILIPDGESTETARAMAFNESGETSRKAGRHHNKNRRNRSNNPTLCSLPSFFFSLLPHVLFPSPVNLTSFTTPPLLPLSLSLFSRSLSTSCITSHATPTSHLPQARKREAKVEREKAGEVKR